jgi:hypothetical protein
MLDRVARQVGIGPEIELLQDAGTVGADGFDAEGQSVIVPPPAIKRNT